MFKRILVIIILCALFGSFTLLAMLGQKDVDGKFLGITELTWIGWGVLVTAVGTLATIIFDVYDRRKQNQTQFLELVRSYSQQLTDLTDKERNLNTKRDCETYAISYLDLMDQIAFLYDKKKIPRDIAKYFGNNFAYAMTMLIWVRELSKELLTDTEKTWKDLENWCNDEDNNIEVFDQDQLPDAMQKYESLPEEDIDKTQLLEVVRSYSQQLTEMTYKERDLKTKLDCELYALAYLDLVDQIAFLYKKGSIPSDIAKYFGNNFSYAMTMLTWLKEKRIEIPKDVDETWTDLVDWCTKQNVEAFDMEQLPEMMLNY